MNAPAVTLTAGGAATAVVLAGLLWLPFAWCRAARPAGRLWLSVPAGGALFLAGAFWVQVPAQAAAGRALLASVPPLTLEAWPVVVAVPLALIAGLVQEAARLAATAGTLRVARRDRAAAPWTGALVGAGVGLCEAAWLLGSIPPSDFSPFGPAVLERLLAITFHIGAGALIGLGIARRRAVGALVLTVLLHGLVDTGAALYQMGRAPAALALWLVGVVGAGLYAVALAAMWRERTGPGGRPATWYGAGTASHRPDSRPRAVGGGPGRTAT